MRQAPALSSMKTLRICLLLAAGFIAGLCHAQFSNGPAVSFTTVDFVGQSFTTPNDGTADLMTNFTWLDDSGLPMGAGQVYVFSQEYTGVPSGLASGAGLLGVSNTFAGGSYAFSTSINLNPNTEYWVYTSTAQQVGVTFSNAYGAGDFFDSPGSGSAYTKDTSFEDAAFAVTATAVPEPSTYAAFAGVAALGLALWRRRA